MMAILMHDGRNRGRERGREIVREGQGEREREKEKQGEGEGILSVIWSKKQRLRISW